MELILTLLLGVSLSANAVLGLYLKRSKKKRPLDITAEEILHDLTAGISLIRVERVNPGDVFLRSPRG